MVFLDQEFAQSAVRAGRKSRRSSLSSFESNVSRAGRLVDFCDSKKIEGLGKITGLHSHQCLNVARLLGKVRPAGETYAYSLEDDEHLRENGECGRGECDEVAGNNVCNYCATREAWKYANYVEVFPVESL